MKKETSIAERLKKLRNERDWTQEQLASELMIDRSYLSQIEGGHKTPSVRLVARLDFIEQSTKKVSESPSVEISEKTKRFHQEFNKAREKTYPFLQVLKAGAEVTFEHLGMCSEGMRDILIRQLNDEMIKYDELTRKEFDAMREASLEVARARHGIDINKK